MIEITVDGDKDSGKHSVARIIEDALLPYGIKVNLTYYSIGDSISHECHKDEIDLETLKMFLHGCISEVELNICDLTDE